MKERVLSLTLFVFAAHASSGQGSDTTFYPTGQIREIKIVQGDQILQATAYKPDGQVKYQWDIVKKEFESFDGISYDDALAAYFRSNCPDYTLYQHYGNGPIKEIENYQEGVRHGAYQEFERDGKLISEGQFDNWEKVGTWSYYDASGNADRHIHWFHHDFSERGISITYTIVPVVVALCFSFIILIVCLRYSSFSIFFTSYSLATIGLFGVLYLVTSVSDEQTMEAIRTHGGRYFFPVLSTLTLIMTAFSLTALTFRNRTGVKRLVSFLFLVTSIGLCYLLIGAYIGAKLAGAVM